MTPGEQMVWAASYSAEIARRLHDPTKTWPGLGPNDAIAAAMVAWRTVTTLRFGVNVETNSPEAHEFWLEMVGLSKR